MHRSENLLCSIFYKTQHNSMTDDNATYLVVVVVAMEKRFFSEDHACKHAAQAP